MFLKALIVLATLAGVNAGCVRSGSSCPTSNVSQCDLCGVFTQFLTDAISSALDENRTLLKGFDTGIIEIQEPGMPGIAVDTGLESPILEIAIVPEVGTYFTTANGLFRLDGDVATPIVFDPCEENPSFSGLDWNPTDCKLYFGNPGMSRIERFDPRNLATREVFVETSPAPRDIAIDRCRQRILYIDDDGDVDAVDLSTKVEDPLLWAAGTYVDVDYNWIFISLVPSDQSAVVRWSEDGILESTIFTGIKTMSSTEKACDAAM